MAAITFWEKPGCANNARQTAMLRAAGFTGVGNDESPSAVADGLGVFLSSGLGDAGTGFEPVTFRL